MNAEFNVWLLVVGLVVGAGLLWLVLADIRRHDEEQSAAEVANEAAWIAETLAGEGIPADKGIVRSVLRLHRAYLRASLPPEERLPDETEEKPVPASQEPERTAEPERRAD